jgi:hypothetical protein
MQRPALAAAPTLVNLFHPGRILPWSVHGRISHPFLILLYLVQVLSCKPARVEVVLKG